MAVSEIRKGWKNAVVRISFAMGQFKIVETLSFSYAIY